MSVINTNYLALVSQNNLTKSQNALGTAIERLSSGLRINSAKDDAAGQAIANRFTANIKGLTQAQRNANDGISIAQTTEGALNEINNNLQRIRELTVQAANGTNSDTDLASIQAEITQRLGEIDRVSEQTQFNGVKVLAKTEGLTIQVGANDGETITINLKEINSTELKLDTLDVTSKGVGVAFDPAGYDDGADGTESTSASAVAYAKGTGNDDIDLDGARAVETEGGDVYVITKSNDIYKAGTVAADETGATVTITLADNAEVVDAETAAEVAPLLAIDKALQQVDDLRSDLGAIQNRFQSTIANLSNTVNNLSAARSRIEDADYAVEVSNMTRAQILQQAGTSVLAQANQVPQGVLSLLR